MLVGSLVGFYGIPTLSELSNAKVCLFKSNYMVSRISCNDYHLQTIYNSKKLLLKQIICTQIFGFKYSNLILIIYAQGFK